MIYLTKINGEQFLVNCDQIGTIESIPESKVVMMNKEYFIVKEKPQEIIDKIIDYRAMLARKIVTVNT